MKLQFKLWIESEFGRGILDEPEPSSEIPRLMAKVYGGAYPTYDLEPLPGNKKPMKKAKKQTKH